MERIYRAMERIYRGGGNTPECKFSVCGASLYLAPKCRFSLYGANLYPTPECRFSVYGASLYPTPEYRFLLCRGSLYLIESYYREWNQETSAGVEYSNIWIEV